MTPEMRAVSLVQLMASAKCKNKYPVGVIGAQARMHYQEARRIADAMQMRETEKP